MANYQQGWQDLYSLMQNGRSFSGRERNCCFLNLSKSERIHFADISFLSGADFADDARSIAVTDWDLDGDQDFWVTNRTSPRVRVMLNSLSTPGRSLTIKLVGSSCNRDAVGARVTVFPDGSHSTTRTQTVRAGSGFMSQSSRWLHFGLGDSSGISKAEIRWPGQKNSESIAGLKPNHRYTIKQGKGVIQTQRYQAADFTPVKTKPDIQAKLPNHAARTLVVGRVPLPPIDFLDRQGNRIRLSSRGDRTTLINIWTASCPACIHELQDWTNASSKINDANLEVLALTPRDGQMSESGTVDAVLDRIGFPFQVGVIDDRTVEMLTAFQNSFWDRHRRFAVPTSFLLDRFQRVIAIYRGRVGVDQLLSDVKLAEAAADTVRQHVTDLPGRWFGPVSRPRVLSMTNSLRKTGVTATDYLKHCLEIQSRLPQSDDFRLRPTESANLYFALGTELLSSNKPQEAMAEFTKAIRLDPHHRGAHANLGAANFQAKRWPQAEFHFGQALAVDSADVDMLVNRSISRLHQNELRPAITDFKAALKLDSDDLRANFNMALAMRATRNELLVIKYLRKSLSLDSNLMEAKFHLAWALATASDKRLRNGAEAVRIAEELNSTTKSQEASILNLLAASLAEAGRFDEAVKTIDHAIQVAKAKKQTGLVGRLQKSRTIYQQRAGENQSNPGVNP